MNVKPVFAFSQCHAGKLIFYKVVQRNVQKMWQDIFFIKALPLSATIIVTIGQYLWHRLSSWLFADYVL